MATALTQGHDVRTAVVDILVSFHALAASVVSAGSDSQIQALVEDLTAGLITDLQPYGLTATVRCEPGSRLQVYLTPITPVEVAE